MYAGVLLPNMALSNRCGYRLELGLDEDVPSTEVCERPVWEDHDRCVWHASVETILGTLLSALLVFVLARIVTW